MRRLDAGPELSDPLLPYLGADRPAPAGRPWVLANMVCGIDGSVAIDGRVGALSGPVDRQLFRDMRSIADVVLVGAETARREDYGPVRLDEQRREERRARQMAPVPRLAVVSGSLDLDPSARLFAAGSDTLVLTVTSAPAARRAELERVADVRDAGSERVEPAEALELLAGMGARVVLCEGGPTLLGELLGASLVDELCLTLAPVVGGDPVPVAVLPPSSPARRAELAHVLEADGDLFLRYLFR